jgi:hypothetical protein
MRALTGDASRDSDRLREMEDAVAAVNICGQRIPVAVIAKRAGTPDEVSAVGALLMARTAASSRAVTSSWMAA